MLRLIRGREVSGGSKDLKWITDVAKEDQRGKVRATAASGGFLSPHHFYVRQSFTKSLQAPSPIYPNLVEFLSRLPFRCRQLD